MDFGSIFPKICDNSMISPICGHENCKKEHFTSCHYQNKCWKGKNCAFVHHVCEDFQNGNCKEIKCSKKHETFNSEKKRGK